MKHFLFSALMLSAACASAQVTLKVDAARKGVAVSPDLYGIFYEDINHAADGGLYAELIRNRSFEDDIKQPAFWSTYESPGSSLKLSLATTDLLNAVQGHALQADVKATPAAPVCLVNTGFWGINAVQGRTYRLSFFAKGNYKGALKATLCDATGAAVYAETTVVEKKVTGKWTKYTATLVSKSSDPNAQFAFVADGKGQLFLDVVSLMPPTFNNRPNGLRPDLAGMLADLRPKFFRFPGGCFVEGQGSPDNAFRWERTIGPIEERAGHHNVNWGYRTSDGMGFDEYLQLAEDLGAKPLFVVNVGIWHGGMTPLDEIQPWIDECLNAIEYANGDVKTKYGALRAKNGHPAPYNIEFIEVGNENNQPDPRQQSDHYYERFAKFRDAILAKYPNMHIIGNVAAWGTDSPTWDSQESVELLDEHYYRSPAWFASQFRKYDTYDRKGPGIYVGEYAVTQGFGVNGSLDAALGEAVYMMGMENNSDIVRMASYAPIFANLNDLKWRPDMIQFNSGRVFGTPSYYVQREMAQNVGTRVLAVEQQNPYEGDEEAEKLKPATCGVGYATWNTQSSYQNARLTSPTDMQRKPVERVDISGRWSESDGIISQTSRREGAIRIYPEFFTADEYTYEVRARKDAGQEGFILVFNYVDEKNYCWLNLGGWGNTQHGIEQVVDGAKMQLVTERGSVETGRWYDVRLHVIGDSITASLDGTPLFATRLKPNSFAGLFSTATLDEPTGDVILKVVNTGKRPTTARIELQNHAASKARVIRMSGNSGAAENDITNPTAVYPVSLPLSPTAEGTVELEVPAHSLNIVRISK